MNSTSRAIYRTNKALADLNGWDDVSKNIYKLKEEFTTSTREIKSKIASIRKDIRDPNKNNAQILKDIESCKKFINNKQDDVKKLITTIESSGFKYKDFKKVILAQRSTMVATAFVPDNNTLLSKSAKNISSMNIGMVASELGRCARQFVTVYDKYEKYYDKALKTLEKFEDSINNTIDDVKECLLDFVILSQDIEILLESAE